MPQNKVEVDVTSLIDDSPSEEVDVMSLIEQPSKKKVSTSSNGGEDLLTPQEPLAPPLGSPTNQAVRDKNGLEWGYDSQDDKFVPVGDNKSDYGIPKGDRGYDELYRKLVGAPTNQGNEFSPSSLIQQFGGGQKGNEVGLPPKDFSQGEIAQPQDVLGADKKAFGDYMNVASQDVNIRRGMNMLKQNPNDEQGIVEIGKGYLNIGNDATAQKAFDDALALNPNNVDALRGSAHLAGKKEDYKTALQFQKQAAQISNQLSDYRDVARLQLSGSESGMGVTASEAITTINEALKTLDVVTQQNPEDYQAWQLKSMAENKLGNKQAALESLNQSQLQWTIQISPVIKAIQDAEDKASTDNRPFEEELLDGLKNLRDRMGEREGAFLGKALNTPEFLFNNASTVLHGAQEMKEGVKRVFSNPLSPTNDLNGYLQYVGGAADVLMGVGMTTPAGFVFVQGIGQADVLTNDMASKILMAPISTLAPTDNELGQRVEKTLDLTVSLLALGAAHHKLAGRKEVAETLKSAQEKLESGKDLTGAEVIAGTQNNQQLLNTKATEELRTATEKIPPETPEQKVVPIATQIAIKDAAEKEKLNLETQKAKLDENFHEQKDKEIEVAEKTKEDANDEIKFILDSKDKTEPIELPVEAEKVVEGDKALVENVSDMGVEGSKLPENTDMPKSILNVLSEDKTLTDLKQKHDQLNKEKIAAMTSRSIRGSDLGKWNDEIGGIESLIEKRRATLRDRHYRDIDERVKSGEFEKLVDEGKISPEEAQKIIKEGVTEVPKSISDKVIQNRKNKENATDSILGRSTDFFGKAKEEWMVALDDVNVRDKETADYVKGHIERALKSAKFDFAIEEGRMTAKDAVHIIKSAKLKVPDRFLDLAKKESPKSQPTPTESAPTGITSDVKGDEIEGFRSEFSDSPKFIQKSSGKYIALDEPFDNRGITGEKLGEAVSTEKVTVKINRKKIFDPEKMLEGTETSKAQKEKVEDAFFEAVKSSDVKGGSREMANLRTEVLKSFGYEGEVGAIYPSEAKSPRELILFDSKKSETPTPQKEGESIMKEGADVKTLVKSLSNTSEGRRDVESKKKTLLDNGYAEVDLTPLSYEQRVDVMQKVLDSKNEPIVYRKDGSEISTNRRNLALGARDLPYSAIVPKDVAAKLKSQKPPEVQIEKPILAEGEVSAGKEVPKTKFQLAKEKASQSLKEANDNRKANNQNLKAVKDPLKEAKKQAELDRKAFDDLVDVAREAVNEGIKSVKDFAKELGEEVSDLVQKAWDVANKAVKYEDAVKDFEPPTKPPKAEEAKGEGGKPKAILNRLHDSEFATDAQRKRLEDEGLEYKPQSHEEARKLAQVVVKEYGTENAVALAEAGKFDGDVNSLIFAESIDASYWLEKNAKTAAEKEVYGEQWADYSIRYDKAGLKGGRFTSAIYDFYKKSPIGIRIKENRIREGVFKDWYKSKEEAYKDFWGEVTRNPKFQELVKAGAETYKARAKKFADVLRKGKIEKDIVMVGVPFVKEVWNGAIEAAAKAVEVSGIAADGLKAGLQHIKDSKWYKGLSEENQAKAEARFTDYANKSESDSATPKKKITKEDENKIVDKWSKKLQGLPTEKREQFIRDIVKAVVQKGELSYGDFKKLLSEATGLGKITAKEGVMIDKYVEAANKVTELSDKAQSEGTPQAIKEWENAVRQAERTATDLADIVYKETNLTNRITSLVSLNTLGFGTLIKNIGYNVAQQALIRFPKALIGTAIDYTAYGITLAGNKVFGTPILKPSTNVWLAQRGYFRNLALGTKDVSVKIRRGGTYKDYFQQGIQHPRIKPLMSARDLRAWRFGRGTKALTSKQVADKILQATSGVPAEIIARGLLTGDTPPRWAAEGARAHQIARLEFGIKDKGELELFRIFPEEQAKKKFLERGLTEEQAQTKAADVKKQILEAGDDATLTMDNLATDLVSAIKTWGEGLSKDSAGGDLANTVGRLAGVLNIPYLKIPINAAWLAMNIRNPILPMAQSAYYGARWLKTRDPSTLRKSKDWLNIAAVGVATNAVAAWMVNNSIVTPRQTDDETKKESDITTEFDRQYSMNVDKLLRGGGETEDGDVSIDLSWFGGQGAVLNTAAQQREKELEEGQMSAMDEMAFNLSRGGIEGFTSSVFGTTNSLINAYTMGGGYVHQLGLQYFNTAANVAEPAMISQISKNGFGRNLDIRGDTFGDALSKTIYQRSFGLVGTKPETRLGIFGTEQVKEGSYLGRVLTGTLGAEISDTDKMGYPIYEMYNQTHNADLVPPTIPKTISVDGENVKLTYDQQRELSVLIGSTRIEFVGAFLNNQASLYTESGGWQYMNEMTPDQIAEALKKMYDKGGDLGRDKFKLLHPEFTSTKDTAPQGSRTPTPNRGTTQSGRESAQPNR